MDIINDNTLSSVEEARRYIAIFRVHTLNGAAWVETDSRRILLDQMTDEDALFVASEFARIETEAAMRARRRRRIS